MLDVMSKSFGRVVPALESCGFELLSEDENCIYYSRSGLLWSTYVFALVNLSNSSVKDEIRNVYSWVESNVERRIQLAQIGLNVVIQSDGDLDSFDLKSFVDKHGVKDLKKLSTSRTQIITNTKDIIFQTVIASNPNTTAFQAHRTWALLGSVRCAYYAIIRNLSNLQQT